MGHMIGDMISPSKSSRHRSSELSWLTTLHPCCHALLLGELNSSCVTLVRGLTEARTWFPMTAPMYLFLFWLCLKSPFSAINYSRECSILSPESPLVDHQHTGGFKFLQHSKVLSLPFGSSQMCKERKHIHLKL